MAMTRVSKLSLYKQMLREAEKFGDFNYRSYALRRIRDGFRSNRDLESEEAVKSKVEEARTNFELIRRQTTIGHLFASGSKLSIEAALESKRK